MGDGKGSTRAEAAHLLNVPADKVLIVRRLEKGTWTTYIGVALMVGRTPVIDFRKAHGWGADTREALRVLRNRVKHHR